MFPFAVWERNSGKQLSTIRAFQFRPGGRRTCGAAGKCGLSHPGGWELPPLLPEALGSSCVQAAAPWTLHSIYISSINFFHLSGYCEISPLTKCREMSQTYFGWERHQLSVFFSSQKVGSAMEGPLRFALRKFEMPKFHGLCITWGTPTVPHVLTNMCLAN